MAFPTPTFSKNPKKIGKKNTENMLLGPAGRGPNPLGSSGLDFGLLGPPGLHSNLSRLPRVNVEFWVGS